ncbi:hypothetical protein OROHE_009947 [Orobanche hederae]
MASSNPSSPYSGEYVHRNIPEVDIYFCDKLCVERYCWLDENAVKTIVPSNKWYIYSGCSNHMSENEHLFMELEKEERGFVTLGNNKNNKIKDTYKMVFTPEKDSVDDDDASMVPADKVFEALKELEKLDINSEKLEETPYNLSEEWQM